MNDPERLGARRCRAARPTSTRCGGRLDRPGLVPLAERRLAAFRPTSTIRDPGGISATWKMSFSSISPISSASAGGDRARRRLSRPPGSPGPSSRRRRRASLFDGAAPRPRRRALSPPRRMRFRLAERPRDLLLQGHQRPVARRPHGDELAMLRARQAPVADPGLRALSGNRPRRLARRRSHGRLEAAIQARLLCGLRWHPHRLTSSRSGKRA